MEDEERALFAEQRDAAPSKPASGEVLDAALEDLGWRDALAADRRAAVSLLFDAAGRANATSSALDWLLADALGAPEEAAVVLASPARVGATGPGQSGRCTVAGLGSAALGRTRARAAGRGRLRPKVWSRSWCPSRNSSAAPARRYRSGARSLRGARRGRA